MPHPAPPPASGPCTRRDAARRGRVRRIAARPGGAGPALVGALLLAAAATAAPDRPRPDAPDAADAADGADLDLRRRIAQLEGEVRELAGPVGDRRDADAAQRRALALAVLADADLRAARLDDAAAGGHDGRFFVASADGDFRLDVTAFLQVAWYASRRSGGGEAGIDPFVDGFELRRTRVKFRGTVLDPRLHFELGGSFDRGSGALELSDAFVRWTVSDDLRVAVGNHKPFFLWEWGVSARRLLFADRSLVSKRFAPDRAPGIHAGWTPFGADAPLALFASLADPDPGLDGRDHAASARATWRLAGAARDLRDFVGRPGDELGVQFGAGILDRRVAGDDRRAYTMDGTVQGDGWCIGGGAVLARDEEGAGPMRTRRSPWAAMVHAGVFVAPDTLVALEVVHGDGDEDAADLLTTTIGLVHFVDGDRLKWNLEAGYGWHPVADSWASSGAGWLADAPGEDGQVIVRTQVQLGF